MIYYHATLQTELTETAEIRNTENKHLLLLSLLLLLLL